VVGEQPQFILLVSPSRAGTMVAVAVATVVVAGDMEAVTGPQIISKSSLLFS
jgi:hypothetical protein